jgi:hypothetical protein
MMIVIRQMMMLRVAMGMIVIVMVVRVTDHQP